MLRWPVGAPYYSAAVGAPYYSVAVWAPYYSVAVAGGCALL